MVSHSSVYFLMVFVFLVSHGVSSSFLNVVFIGFSDGGSMVFVFFQVIFGWS